MTEYYAVIMAGGGGTRFWPKSRQARPKQFLPVVGDDPLITRTVERLADGCDPERILIITNRLQLEGTRERIDALPQENLIAEPEGRNTAPCVGLAAVLAQVRSGDDPVVGVFPADAHVQPEAAFTRTVQAAATLAAETGGIVTIGVRPDHAATGYGYIQQGGAVDFTGEVPAHAVERFTEKPDDQTARRFVEDGGYLWNAGIFLFRASTVLEELRRQQPEIHQRLEAFRPQAGTDRQDEALAAAYDQMPSISFDYAVMEGAESVYVVEAQFEWDDLGSWSSVARHNEADADGNVLRGEVIAVDAHNNTVDAERPVALVGVEGLVVVDAGDALLVCRRDRAQDVKRVVEHLRETGRDELL